MLSLDCLGMEGVELGDDVQGRDMRKDNTPERGIEIRYLDISHDNLGSTGRNTASCGMKVMQLAHLQVLPCYLI